MSTRFATETKGVTRQPLRKPKSRVEELEQLLAAERAAERKGETKRAATRGAEVKRPRFSDVAESEDDEPMRDAGRTRAPFRYDPATGERTYVGRRVSDVHKERKKAEYKQRRLLKAQSQPGYNPLTAAKRRQNIRALNKNDDLGRSNLQVMQARAEASRLVREEKRGPLSKRDQNAFGNILAQSKDVTTTSPSAIKKILGQYPKDPAGRESRVGERKAGGFYPINAPTANELYELAAENQAIDQATWDSIHNGAQRPREYRVAKWINNNIKELWGQLEDQNLPERIVSEYTANRNAFFDNVSVGDRQRAADNLTAFASRQLGARSLANLSFDGTALSGVKLRAVDSRALRSELDRMLRGRSASPKNIQNVLAALAYTLQVIAIAQANRNKRVSDVLKELRGPEAAAVRAAMEVGSEDIRKAEKVAQDINRVAGKKLNVNKRVTKKNQLTGINFDD